MLSLGTSFAQSGLHLWTDIEESSISLSSAAERTVIPNHYRNLSLDFESLKTLLATAPMEYSAEGVPINIQLPLPDGKMETFQLVESPVMMPGLAAKFPNIKSYLGWGVDNKSIKVRFDTSPKGFNASMMTPKGKVHISPYASHQTKHYISFYKKDSNFDTEESRLSCGTDMASIRNNPLNNIELPEPTSVESRGNDSEPMFMHTYRLALACTGEFGRSHGGTVESVMADFNTIINAVNQIFESEVSVRMMLIDRNDELIFLEPATDNYSMANVGGALLSQNTAVLINTLNGAQHYDIGHVFTNSCTDVGGVAGGQVCTQGKAEGVTCHSSSNVLGALGTMAHEIAHQFDVGHSWNNCSNPDPDDPNLGSQFRAASAFEPGSGSTIMSYNGACGDQNIQFGRDLYYNIGALDEFIFYSREGGGNCHVALPTNNTEPKITLPYQDGFYIPTSTPFELEGAAIDAEGDNMTFIWEQYNLGPQSPLGMPELNAPSFRTYPPSAEGFKRVFPKMETIVSNGQDITEVLPTYGRNMKFRFVIRDNNPEANASVWEEVSFEVHENAGPFLVTHPNMNTEKWSVGDYTEVSWDVANTSNPNKVNCQHVNIKLSMDGGFTYPITLVENTPNDGSEFITVPNQISSLTRVRVEAADNIFFDISNQNFQIEEAIVPGYALTVGQMNQKICLPAIVEFPIETSSLVGYDSLITLDIVDGLPPGVEASFGSQQLLPSENTTLSLDLSMTNLTEVVVLTLRATAPGTDTTHRILTLDIIGNDFSDMVQLEPVNGTTALEGSPTFTWESSSNALSYDIEIATNPEFNQIIEEATNLNSSSYSLQTVLDENTVYYWRVRPVNRCGVGPFLPPFAFQTFTASCAAIPSTDVPTGLPSSITSTFSTIVITEAGLINGIKVPVVKGTYDGIKGLVMTLESPMGTTAVLFNQECSFTNAFHMGFNDNATIPVGTECPPITGTEYIPVEALSVFNNENPQGTWKLNIEIKDSGFGGGGSLDEWAIEFCANFTPSAPYLVNNEVFRLPSGAISQITSPILLAEDDDNASDELFYTLVTTPEYGVLLLNETPLEVGSRFRQVDINAALISYQHDGGDSTEDQFFFTIDDQEGGWLGTPAFDIEISDDAPVSTTEVNLEQAITLYPNPAQDKLFVQIDKVLKGAVNLSVFNMQGQQMSHQKYASATTTKVLDTSKLTNGIYFVQLRTEEGTMTKKVSIQRR